MIAFLGLAELDPRPLASAHWRPAVDLGNIGNNSRNYFDRGSTLRTLRCARAPAPRARGLAHDARSKLAHTPQFMDKLSEEQIAELREGFNSVDVDGGGSLSPQEVLKFLKQIGQKFVAL